MSRQTTVKKVCVIGAGTMGSGIAAHLANLGFEVTLLDATQQTIVEAFERAKQAKPARFYLPERALDIRIGSTADNLDWISEADWVCEAIAERVGAKRSLFQRIQALIRPDAYISTNTSGIQISLLSEGLSESFRSRFVGTHFFNPPRHLKLLELIPTKDTDPGLVLEMTRFLEESVARRVVVAKDTPGFIANRYGMWCMFQAIHVAERLHLSVEQVDAISGTFLGRPKSATFRLNDLVGIDIMHDIVQNLIERCPNDPHIQNLKTPASVAALIERNWLGDKTGQGYYRREGRELLVLDLSTLAYRQQSAVNLPAIRELESVPLGDRFAKVLDRKDEAGEFARHYLLPALRYADYLKEEISHSVLDIDRVMNWGFGWSFGPFQTLDLIGSERAGLPAVKFYEHGQVRGFDGKFTDVPIDKHYICLEDCPIHQSHETYNLRDLHDGVTAVCIKTKMGMITPQLVRDLRSLLESKKLDRFVLTSEGISFSVGYDLKFFQRAILEERWIDIDNALIELQELGELLEGSRAVAATFGHTLGAGLELALSCPQVVARVESQIGLPESKVGLIPGGRGTTLMRLYNQQSAKRLSEITFNLATGSVSNNAEDARSLGYLRSTDITVFHPDRLLYEAKQAARIVEPTRRPELSAATGPLSGMIDRLLEVAIARGEMSSYDETIGQKMKMIVSKATSYDDCLTKERTEFLDLCTRALTIARINHMLMSGSALRN